MGNRAQPVLPLAGILCCLLLFQVAALAARKVELKLPWSQLATVVQEQQVRLILPSGVHLQGKVLEVAAEALVLHVSRTSDSKAQPKGKTSIARSDVSVIQLTEIKGSKRALWTGVGATAGALAGWALAEGVLHVSGEGQGVFNEPEGVGLLLGFAGGGAALGYFIGRDSDKVETYITVADQPKR
jgi:hypothetical protein